MPKLDTKNVALIPKSKADEFQSAFTLVDEVQEQMREQFGLDAYPRPTGGGPPPLGNFEEGQLETMSNQALGALYARYIAHAQYVGQALAVSTAAYKISTNVLKQVTAELQSRFFAQDVAKSEIPTRVKQDPLFQQYEAEVVKLFTTKTILGAHYKAYEKQAQALSRIIEIRKLEFETNLRQNNLGKARPGQFRKPSFG